MGLNEEIALILLNPRTKQVQNVVFLQSTLRFKCQQCSIFCCRLGGPKLFKNDVERFEQAGYDKERFLNAEHNALKNTIDSSCIYLSTEAEEGLSTCSVYSARPILCRLYPFCFGKLGSDRYLLKFIPCCNGFNAENGESIDETFFDRYLKELLLELIDSGAL